MQLPVIRSLALLSAAGALMSGCAPTVPVAPPVPPRVAPPPPAPAPPPPAPVPAPAPAAASVVAIPMPMPMPVQEKVTYAADIFFSASSTVLSPEAKARVVEFAQKLRGLKLEVVIVVGHADSKEQATDAAALQLSRARADRVKAVLVEQGIEAHRVATEGKGSKQPMADNTTAQGRAKNRRAELELVGTRSAAWETPGQAATQPPKGHVPVLFGTNRARTGMNEPAEYFGSRESTADPAGRLTLGRVVVRVPPNRLRGEIKEPGYFALTLQKVMSSPLASLVGLKPVPAVNQDTDFSFVGAVEEFNEPDFAKILQASIARSKSRATLVYVHGFANSFKDAAFRTAQFAYDLTDADYDVVPVLFTWPSDPSKVNYVGATDRAWSAGQQLAAFLDKLTATTGSGVVHIVAHSKGAQVLGYALQTLRASNLVAIGQDGARLVPRFNQIILAAPDIRAEDFSSLLLPAVATHHSVTNYVSSNDAALKASKRLNEGFRAGDSANTAILIQGVETIDVTAVNYRPGGHSSFADSARVIADIRQQLSGKTPQARSLARVVRRDTGYWLLKE